MTRKLGKAATGRFALAACAALMMFMVMCAAQAQLKLPKGGVFGRGGDLRGQAETAVTRAIGQALGAGSPLLLDQNSAYSRAPEIGDFHPTRLEPASEEDLNRPLPPGDYSVSVIAYCTQFSIHAPGQGLPYKLAPTVGAQAKAISALIARGTLNRLSPHVLNADAWRIQAGLPVSKWPEADRALVHQLIPEFESGLDGDFLEKVEKTYGQFRLIPGLPPFETMLKQTGPGQTVMILRQARQALSDRTIAAERLPDMLYERQPDGLPRVLPASKDSSPSPWAEVIQGVFARFTIIKGHMGQNLLEFRVTPGALVSWDNRSLHGALCSKPGGGASLSNVMGLGDPAGQGASLRISYPVGRAAQDLIPVPILNTPKLPGKRLCCAFCFSPSIDPTKLAGHQYGAGNPTEQGGPVGYVYTDQAGLVDLGHARDVADMTEYVYTQLSSGQTKFKLYEGSVAVTTIPPDQRSRLELAGSIAYVEGWAHELGTWGGVEDFSAFSPEDLPSNIVGIFAAERAINAGGDFNQAMDQALSDTINELKPATQAETDRFLAEIKNKWYARSMLPLLPCSLLRRNFTGRPWAKHPAGWLDPSVFKPNLDKFVYVMDKPVRGSAITLPTMQQTTNSIHDTFIAGHPGMDKP